MLPILVALSLSQLDVPPPPPLVPAEPPLEVQTAPPLVRVEEARAAQVSFMKEIELTRQLSAVSLQMAELDVSGPGWATGLRGLGYALVIPAFLFIAPVVSGSSVVVGAANLVSATQTLTPTLNLVGVALTVAASIALGLGIGGGVVGWMLKRSQLQSLQREKASLEQALDLHRATFRAR